VKVVEAKPERWRSALRAEVLVFKYASSRSVLASFSRCSQCARNVKVRENASTQRTDVKTARVAKSPASAKYSRFMLTKVQIAH